MSMLADPRRKQKWTLNPRGKQWSEDSNKFGQKMLEKMGWSSGKGLGAREQGMTEHVRVKFKDDSSGIGYNKNDQDKQWTQHQDGFNDLLMNLQKTQNMEQTEVMETKEISLSGTSLEQKSKQSRSRVHYQKFTRGKDVNKYSSKDLANIFGKKTLDEETVKKEEAEEEEEFYAEPVGTEDHTAGVVTIKGGNMSDYFKTKMTPRVQENLEDTSKDDDSESERYVGFGFNNKKSDQCDNHSQSVHTNYAFENPCLDLSDTPEIKSPRKRKNVGFTNEGLDLNYPDKVHTPKKVKTEFEVCETSDCFVNPALNLETPDIESCNGAEFEVPRFESHELPAESTKKKKKKKKRKNDIESGFVNTGLNLDILDSGRQNGTEFEVTRDPVGLDNDALDLSDENCGKKRVTFNDCVEYNTDVIKKKKGKTKLDKFEIENEKVKQKKKKRASSEEVAMVFVNPALDVETISEEVQDNELNERKCRKEKRKKNRRMSSLETIVEAPEEKENEEVIRDLEVIALDNSINEAPDEICVEMPKKSKKKKKVKDNLEVIEVENCVEEISLNEDNLQPEENNVAKKKKKKKAKKDKVVEIDVTNELDKENESACKEREKKKKKKRKSSETCEFFLDIIEDNYQEIKEEIVEKPLEEKKSRKKRLRDEEIEQELQISEDCSTPSKKQCLGQEVFSEVTESPQEAVLKKSKNVFKTIFAKSSAIHFKGSNLHDIKGYGVDC